MWKRMLAILMLLMLPMCSLAEDETLDEKIEAIFKRYKVVGGVVVVGKAGEIVYHYDYGMADKKSETPVTPDTYFRLASVTKMVTGIRTMQLVEQGLINLDDPLGNYLGFRVRHPRYKKDVTLRMLMSHTASMYGTVPETMTLEALVKRKSTWQDWAPGAKYRYTNFTGAISSIIEAATGEDVNTSVQENVFKPLGIDGAYRVRLLEEPEMAASVYTEEGRLSRSRESYMEVEWSGVADPNNHHTLGIGGLWMRGDDLCRVGMMMCGGGTLDGVTILKEETVAEMISSQEGKGGIKVDAPYALCVHRITSLLKDRMVYGHQGQSEGIVCNLYWEPESEMVFVLITNGGKRYLDDYIVTTSRKAFAAVWEEYGE